MKLRIYLLVILSLFLASSLEGGVLSDNPCLRGDEPAATLLFPYFEVDLSDPYGLTTLVAITNANAAPALAKVIVWSDWALPIFSFNVYLSGFDVQTLNMRDVLRGVLPQTGADSSQRGNRSDANVNLPGCDALNVGASDLDVEFIQAALSGEELGEKCWASSAHYPGQARGYLTVDAVNRCSELLPGDAGYFEEGGTGVASNENTLLGDFFLVNPAGDFAEADTAVHLVADGDFFEPGDETFYAEYVAGSGRDARIPLSDRYGVRFLRGGGFDGGTDLVVWKDVREVPEGPPFCRPGGFRLSGPSCLAHFEFKILFDEEENALLLDSPISDAPVFHLASQRVPVERLSPWDFGWMDMELGDQSWVGAIVTAERRFSVGFSAWPLNDLCRTLE